MRAPRFTWGNVYSVVRCLAENGRIWEYHAVSALEVAAACNCLEDWLRRD